MTSLCKENNVRKQRAQNNVISFMPGNNYRPESQISVGAFVSTQTEVHRFQQSFGGDWHAHTFIQL